MHMMYMLLILSVVFLAAMFLMCLFRDRLNNPVINPLFLIASAIFFFCWTYATYERNGLENGFMTLDNISPLICTIIPVTPLLNKKVKDFVYCAISFLSLGMFVAMLVSPGADYFMHFQQNAKFHHVSEGACHLIMGLYGYYLILSGKVEISFKSLAKGAAFIYASVFFGVFLNWCFHLGHFGMDMYGNYSIYFIDIFGSFEATFVAYLVGILGTVILGFLSAIFIDWVATPKIKEAPIPNRTDVEETI